MDELRKGDALVLEAGPAVYVIEKRARSSAPWNFLCAFGDPHLAARWFLKPRKKSAQYRCRCLTFGEDVTALITKSTAISGVLDISTNQTEIKPATGLN
ncbi:hypothetical protein [Terriglobus sp. TAA 43]|uniref:hypothetical protein n=1 Tax=Terriglobus sp. TAA 43 TaxID=278961 RepID=UPI000648F7D9|nr:hypothetical protein [Terriglobus sp. TAA 43]